MEITDVTAVTVDAPLTSTDERLGIALYITDHGELESMERVLIRADTNEGIEGWGEVRVFLSPMTTELLIEGGIGPMVVGQSSFEIERLRQQVFVEYTNVDMFFPAVGTVYWDIVGKALDRPIYELLGGWTASTQNTPQHRSYVADGTRNPGPVPAAFCLGILPPEESRVKAREALDAGFDVLKTKAGRDRRQDTARIKAMRGETDGQLKFRLDSNQGWMPDQAVRVGAMLKDEGIYLQYLGQPIRVDSHISFARLRQRLRQPTAPNENTYMPYNISSFVEADAMDAGVIDLTPAGGINGIRQQTAIFGDAGVPFTHHCAFNLRIRTAIILHAVSGIPDFSLPPDPTYYAWEGDVISEPFEVEDGCLPVPLGPGLGISVDRDAVEAYRI